MRVGIVDWHSIGFPEILSICIVESGALSLPGSSGLYILLDQLLFSYVCKRTLRLCG